MQKTISYEPYCVDGCLVVPQEDKKLTSVYNVLDGAPVLKPYLEISALPKQVSLRSKADRQVFDILNKSGLYRNEKSVRNSFFTPFEKGELSDKFDSSVLLKLTTADFIWYLLNTKKSEFYGIWFTDLSYDWPEYKVLQMNDVKTMNGIDNFDKEIRERAKWLRDRIEFSNKYFGHIK